MMVGSLLNLAVKILSLTSFLAKSLHFPDIRSILFLISQSPQAHY